MSNCSCRIDFPILNREVVREFMAESYKKSIDPWFCPSCRRYYWAISAGLPPELFTNTLWLGRIYNLNNTFQLLYPQYSIGNSYGNGFGAIGYSNLIDYLAWLRILVYRTWGQYTDYKH